MIPATIINYINQKIVPLSLLGSASSWSLFSIDKYIDAVEGIMGILVSVGTLIVIAINVCEKLKKWFKKKSNR